MRVLKVQGKGQVSAEPDTVTLSFSVECRSMDYAESLQKLNAQTEDLRASMTAAGINRAELRTSAFGVRVETIYDDGKHVFAGYRASHNLSIELPLKKDLLNKALRHVAKGRSEAQTQLSFSVKDKDALRKRVLEAAVQTAKINAETLASAAGIKLGKLQQMDYGWAEVRIYNQEMNMVCSDSAGTSEYNADIEPEDVTAEDNVTLVYEILD